MERRKFSDLGLSLPVQQALADMGFEEATPIQSLAIPKLLEGRDIIGQAQTGTGKTATFGIPIIERVKPQVREVQAIILCPTRELAIQVADELQRISAKISGLNVLPIYGGQPIDRQIRALQSRTVQIVVGTPGRVLDHLNRGTLTLGSVSMFTLDEADEMLDMGFRPDIESILDLISDNAQKIFFSATMSGEIMRWMKAHQKADALELKIEHKELTVAKIEQLYVEVISRQKLEALSLLIDYHNPKLALVFCNTKRMVDLTVEHLMRRGCAAAGLHGDMKQRARDRVMENFRAGHTQVLVATDVAARGIDVDDVEAVFNYDIPLDEESYVHRVGRTGRAGREGKAFTLVTSRELYHLKRIQRYIKHTIALAKLPTDTDVQERKLAAMLERIKQVLDAGHLSVYARAVESLLSENVTSLDVAAALLKMIGKKARAAVVVDAPAEQEERRPRREYRSDRGGASRGGSGSRMRSRPRRREGSFRQYPA